MLATSILCPALTRSKNEYLKSAAVIFEPSWNLTSSRKSSVKRERVRRELPGLDQFGDQLQVRRLIERLVEHQFVDRLCVGNGALLRVPGRHIARPADRDFFHVGGEHGGGAQERRRSGDANAEGLAQGPARNVNHRNLLYLVCIPAKRRTRSHPPSRKVTRRGTADPLVALSLLPEPRQAIEQSFTEAARGPRAKKSGACDDFAK